MNSGLTVDIRLMRFPDADNDLIRDLKLSVAEGQVVSLLGRSGVGKTTLLRMIAGMERRFDGEVLLDGQPVVRPSCAIRMVFQDFRLLPWKTVYENVAFAMNGKTQGPHRQAIEHWLKTVGLADRQNAWPKALSGGEQGRVAFARAFVDAPSVLLLDEPFRGLDMATKFDLQDEFMREVRRQGSTVVFVSHSIDDAVYLSDTVYHVSDPCMNITAAFRVDVDHPRDRADRRLADIGAEVTKFVCSQPIHSSLRDLSKGQS